MGTSTPDFPNGRFGTIISSDTLVEELLCACAKTPNGAMTDPIPPAQAVLIKSLLEKFPFLPGMLYFSLADKLLCQVLRCGGTDSRKGRNPFLL